MIIPLIKKTLGAVATCPATNSYLNKIFVNRVNVLFFHYFGEKAPYYGLPEARFPLRRLAMDLRLLGKYFQFAPLREVLAASGLPTPARKPLLAISFDDGFDLLGNGVVDLLEEHGIKATFFVITDCLDNRCLMWRHKLYAMVSTVGAGRFVSLYNELTEKTGGSRARNIHQVFSISRREWGPDRKEDLTNHLWTRCRMPQEPEYLAQQKPYLGEADIRHLLARGHELGLHTRSHPLCPRLDDAGVIREIVDPAKLLKDIFGISYLPFAYPFGQRLDQAREEQLFVKCVFSCALGVDGMSPRGCPPYRLERADCESGVDFPVFGRHLLYSLLPFLKREM